MMSLKQCGVCKHLISIGATAAITYQAIYLDVQDLGIPVSVFGPDDTVPGSKDENYGFSLSWA